MKDVFNIFIEDAIVIDYGCFEEGILKGKTEIYDIIFKGRLNEDDVIADFKLLKEIIKKIEKKFDHKLLISDIESFDVKKDFLVVQNENLITKIKSCDVTFVKDINNIKDEIKKFLDVYLKENNLFIEVEVKEKSNNISKDLKFSYTHILEYAYSNECRHLHGHYCFISINDSCSDDIKNIFQKVAKRFNNGFFVSDDFFQKYFYYNENSSKEDIFFLIREKSEQKIIVLESKPTIEVIGREFLKQVLEEIKKQNIEKYYLDFSLTEGYKKGIKFLEMEG